MANELTSGQCRLCDCVFGKRQMTNHLKACWKQRLTSSPGKSTGPWFHLVVESRYSPDYWLHLQASAKSTFGDLDGVLRAIWLECCGHLSAFKFPTKRPARGRPFDLAAMFALRARGGMLESEDEDEDELMGASLGSKLQPGVAFSHDYDFGSTTTLALRVAAEYGAPAMKGAIKVLARNEPSVYLCSVCQKPATQLCQECADGDEGALCEDCSRKHKCGEEMLVPLLNSPRSGVCGYCGPSVEP